MKFMFNHIHVATDNLAQAFSTAPKHVSTPDAGFDGLSGTFFVPTTPVNIAGKDIAWSRFEVNGNLIIRTYPYTTADGIVSPGQTEAASAELGIRAYASLLDRFKTKTVKEVCILALTSDESREQGRVFLGFVFRTN